LRLFLREALHEGGRRLSSAALFRDCRRTNQMRNTGCEEKLVSPR
jgi:hypothetical protein